MHLNLSVKIQNADRKNGGLAKSTGRASLARYSLLLQRCIPTASTLRYGIYYNIIVSQTGAVLTFCADVRQIFRKDEVAESNPEFRSPLTNAGQRHCYPSTDKHWFGSSVKYNHSDVETCLRTECKKSVSNTSPGHWHREGTNTGLFGLHETGVSCDVAGVLDIAVEYQ